MSKAPRLAAALIAALALTATATAVPATAIAAATAAPHPTLLSAEPTFMCVSCHEPLNTVNSPQAITEKHTLARLLNKGEGMSRIKTQMVSIYGPQVLAKPPASGINLLIYILPPALLLAGLALLAFMLPRWRARARRAAARAPAAAPETLSGEQAARLDDELTRFV